MTESPADDKPGFVAEEPEHCHACYRLIRPGQTYYLTIENTVLCTDCALSEGVIRVRDDLAVEVKRDRLLIGRGNSEVEVFAGEIRHLVDALGEAQWASRHSLWWGLTRSKDPPSKGRSCAAGWTGPAAYPHPEPKWLPSGRRPRMTTSTTRR